MWYVCGYVYVVCVCIWCVGVVCGVCYVCIVSKLQLAIMVVKWVWPGAKGEGGCASHDMHVDTS